MCFGIGARHESHIVLFPALPRRDASYGARYCSARGIPVARAEDVSAPAADELGKQLRHIRVEINDAISVLSLWRLSIASPNGLLDLEATAVEITDFKTK